MITRILSTGKGSVQVRLNKGLWRLNWSANHDVNSVLVEQLSSPMPHPAGDDDVGALLMQPARQESRLVRRRIDQFHARHDGVVFVDIDKSELLAMTKMVAKTAIGQWDCESHLFFLVSRLKKNI
jgi:hypothetical protein